MKRSDALLQEVVAAVAERFQAADLCYGHGTDNAWDEAAWLVLHRAGLPLDADVPADSLISAAQQADILEIAKQRMDRRVPLAYLLQSAWFAGLPFYINSEVLVPRSPMAEYIEDGLSYWLDGVANPRLLDLCTGSGCIGVSAAVYIPDSTVYLSDISDTALQIAQRNVNDYGLAQRVHCIHSDLFAAIPEGQRFDLIICNPPYVDKAEMQALSPEFCAEPRLGLAAGEDGLDLVHRILSDAPHYLHDNGVLMLEVGNSAPALEQAYPGHAFCWLSFERGGDGVCVLRYADLVALNPKI